MNRYLCNKKANLLTRLGTRCQKIPGTGHRMTDAGDVDLVSVPISRIGTPTSPARGEVV